MISYIKYSLLAYLPNLFQRIFLNFIKILKFENGETIQETKISPISLPFVAMLPGGFT